MLPGPVLFSVLDLAKSGNMFESMFLSLKIEHNGTVEKLDRFECKLC